MAQAGTLLSDLDGQAGGSDKDLVQAILADMSVPSQRGPPPALPQQAPPGYGQQPNTTAPVTMDSRIPTSHMIGNEHPTPADFAAAMQGMNSVRPHEAMIQGAPVGVMPGVQQQVVASAPTKNLYGRILDEAKLPVLIAILFFVFSLPPIRVLVAHYIPSFLRPTGDLTMVGLAAMAGVVGGMFWLLSRVIAPLLSL